MSSFYNLHSKVSPFHPFFLPARSTDPSADSLLFISLSLFLALLLPLSSFFTCHKLEKERGGPTFSTHSLTQSVSQAHPLRASHGVTLTVLQAGAAFALAGAGGRNRQTECAPRRLSHTARMTEHRGSGGTGNRRQMRLTYETM